MDKCLCVPFSPPPPPSHESASQSRVFRSFFSPQERREKAATSEQGVVKSKVGYAGDGARALLPRTADVGTHRQQRPSEFLDPEHLLPPEGL
jgi:hypothetical protein